MIRARIIFRVSLLAASNSDAQSEDLTVLRRQHFHFGGFVVPVCFAGFYLLRRSIKRRFILIQHLLEQRGIKGAFSGQ